MGENVVQIKCGILINVEVSVKKKKDYIWNPATCSCKNAKYFTNIIDDSVIMCDEVTESYGKETKSLP